jgi:SnoaL-like domain
VAIDPVALVRRYHEALNRFDAREVTPLFARAATYRSPGIGILAGRAAIVGAMDGYFAEHSDQVAEDDSIVAIDDRSARSQWRLTATSNSTGAARIRSGSEVVRFNQHGLIVLVEVEDK